MTWPKMRSIIFSQGIVRGENWKDSRRIVFENTSDSEWGILLNKLGKASEQDIDNITEYDEETKQEDNEQDKLHSTMRSRGRSSLQADASELFSQAEQLLKKG